MEPTELVPRNGHGTPSLTVAEQEFPIERIIEQKKKIQQCMKEVMTKDQHYGIIPGTEKPSLWKPGAETLCFMFRLDPQYEVLASTERTDLVSFTIRCTLYHIPTGNRIASGLGSCNSREAKYSRPSPRKCPKCSAEAIIKGKPEYEKEAKYKGGWLCYAKKQGCGAKYVADDTAITGQIMTAMDPSDLHNTLLKMACKRAHIAATLAGTAASDFFTQDLEDLVEKSAEYTPPEEKKPVGAFARPKGAPRGPAPKGETPPTDATSAAKPNATATTSPTTADDTLAKNLHDSVYVDVVNSKTGEVTQELRRTLAQHKKIQVLKAQCGFEQNDWEGRMQARFRKSSSKDLSKSEASELIERLTKMVDAARNAAADVAEAIKTPDPMNLPPWMVPGDDVNEDEQPAND